MGITISESDAVFHVPYGLPNSDGTPEASFVDLRAHPEWVPVLPSCMGWPETQDLLRAINSPQSQLMTLAADQAFIESDDRDHQKTLASFVILAYAEARRNKKPAVSTLAAFLNARMSDLLQAASTALQRRLVLNVVLQLQPTVFHLQDTSGWSLRVLMAAYGEDEEEARMTWRISMRVLQESLASHTGLT